MLTRLFLLQVLCLFSSLQLFAQGTITGTVSSAEDNEFLVGATVMIKGSSAGTVTDETGQYIINAPDRKAVLVFSYTGFAPREVEVKGRPFIDVELNSTIEELAEIVVTGTAAGQSQKTLSFSCGRIDETFLQTVPSALLGAGLQAKVPGLRVSTPGGQPGQNAYFQIRAANSLANGQQPLIIVDGVFLNSPNLADINPQDVERVEILKGSAGASLYGSQAANGVIQIFTKRGQKLEAGETRVTYRGEVGFSQEANRYAINRFTNKEIDDPNGPQPVLGALTDDQIFNTELPNLQDYQEDVLFRDGAFHSNYLSVQGKSGKTNFFASAQRLKDEGVIQTSEGYVRNSFRLNIDHQISQKFSLQASSMYSSSTQDLLAPVSNGPGSFIAATLFLTPMFNLDTPNEEDGSRYDWDIDNTSFNTTNPLYDRANSRQTVDRNRLLGSFQLNYYPKEWLRLNYKVTLDRASNDYEQFLHKGFLSTNVPGLFGALATAGVDNSNGGGIHRSQRVSNALTSRVNLIMEKSFSGFNTALRASYLYEDLISKFNEGMGENLAATNIHSLDNARSNIFISSETQEIVGHSYFLIGDIDYRQKYIFSGLIRREGSSLFGPEEHWANYHRLSAAYRISEDMRIPGFQELKLRASMGTAGIRPTFEQRFETLTLINGATTKNTLGNEFLKPALSTETEVGLNGRLFKVFDVEFNYVDTRTEDQILLVPLSGASGFRGQWQNAGVIEATTYEGSVNLDVAKLIRAKNLNWNIIANFDRTEQMITQLDVPAYTTGPGLQQSALFLIEEGLPFGTISGEVFATSLDQLAGQEGVDPNNYTINDAGYVVQKDQLGTVDETPYKLIDAEGNPIVQTIGDINPDFRMGFANVLNYKGLTLYTLFDWKKGGDVYNMTKQWLYRDYRHADVSEHANIAANFYGANGLYNVLVPNNHFVEDGSFFMLREASIAYEFNPAKLRGLAGGLIKGLRLSAIGRNIFTLTKYTGFHPDVSSAPRDENTLTNRYENAPGSDEKTPFGDPSVFAVDGFNYPATRNFTLSVQLTF